MHYRHVFFTWIVCLLVSSCASTIKVDTDYDPENDFSGYQSYDWHDEVSAPNQIVEDRMRNAIELALKANAYVRVESGAAPDFLVSFSAVSGRAIRSDSISTGMGYRRRGWGVGVSTTNRIREYTQGTLVIDIIEPGSKYLLWRGVSVQSLDANRSAEEKTQEVNAVAAAILGKFPPGAD